MSPLDIWTPGLLGIIVLMLAGLAAGSLVRLVGLRRADAQLRSKRLASLRTWWLLTISLALAVLLGSWGACLLLAIAGVLALCEYLRLIGLRPADRRGMWVVFLTFPLHYALILSQRLELASAVTPLVTLLLLTSVQALAGDPSGFTRSTSTLFWGAMMFVYALSHAAFLTVMPLENLAGGASGWLLYLVLLTETNDISQALVGRRLGAHKRHRITPGVSPNKTWEGFVGGLLVTTLLAVALAPALTPLSSVWPGRLAPLAVGILITLCGFAGDIIMSAVKRDAGVKDSGRLLPGMGGMIDRIDSLTFTAPVFYYFVTWIL